MASETANGAGVKRCAIYTRKSVEEGLEMEFNSLDAQREAGEAYVASQRANSWVCLDKHYDDGGFSGGNMNRPALAELLKDCEKGLVDIIVVYKIDRLSRSICDFAELSRKLDLWGVAFVSVTQEINTHTSAGRMMLNILMTFAQFEREVITERVRDKMSASRKKGKWVGGSVPYGYRVVDRRLVPGDPVEVAAVNRIFKRYVEIQSPVTIARELNLDGLALRSGRKFDSMAVNRILRNATYAGLVNYRGEIYPGEHEGIVPMDMWKRVAHFLGVNAPPEPRKRGRPRSRRNVHGTLLDGLIRCGCCDSAMTVVSQKRNGKVYLYYICLKGRRKAGYGERCIVSSVSAPNVDRLVFEQLQRALTAPEVVLDVSRATGVRPSDIMGILSGDLMGEMTYEEKRRIVELLVDRVTICEDCIKIEIKSAGFRPVEEVYDGKQDS